MRAVDVLLADTSQLSQEIALLVTKLSLSPCWKHLHPYLCNPDESAEFSPNGSTQNQRGHVSTLHHQTYLLHLEQVISSGRSMKFGK